MYRLVDQTTPKLYLQTQTCIALLRRQHPSYIYKHRHVLPCCSDNTQVIFTNTDMYCLVAQTTPKLYLQTQTCIALLLRQHPNYIYKHRHVLPCCSDNTQVIFTNTDMYCLAAQTTPKLYLQTQTCIALLLRQHSSYIYKHRHVSPCCSDNTQVIFTNTDMYRLAAQTTPKLYLQTQTCIALLLIQHSSYIYKHRHVSPCCSDNTQVIFTNTDMYRLAAQTTPKLYLQTQTCIALLLIQHSSYIYKHRHVSPCCSDNTQVIFTNTAMYCLAAQTTPKLYLQTQPCIALLLRQLPRYIYKHRHVSPCCSDNTHVIFTHTDMYRLVAQTAPTLYLQTQTCIALLLRQHPRYIYKHRHVSPCCSDNTHVIFTNTDMYRLVAQTTPTLYLQTQTCIALLLRQHPRYIYKQT